MIKPSSTFSSYLIAVIEIGKTIRKLRIDRDLSQQELAKSAALTSSFLSLVENDRRRPSLLVIKKLATALGVPEEVLIWDAVEIPADLSKSDRQMCDMAKLIVRRYYEANHGSAYSQNKGS